MNQQQKWHNLDAEHALRSLESNRQGLTQQEAQQRLRQYGANELQEKRKKSPWLLFLEQFKSMLIYILLGAVALSVIIGEVTDAIVIMVIVLFCGIMGFIQEYRAGKELESLKRMAALSATALRDSEEVEIPARELVPGDVLLLTAGDRVAADARLLEQFNLTVDEAALTGESVPVEKKVDTVPGEVPLGDRRNMVYSGTTVTFGRGSAVVAATGMNTEFGKIAGMLQEVEEKETPLEANLNRVGKWLGIAGLSICGMVAALGIFRGHAILEMVIWGVSLSIAAVPEALPAVVTISMALGVRRMVKRHALIRSLPAVETLGCTTVICSDKTGTLTQNEMTVRRIYVDGRIIDVSGVGYEPKGEFHTDGTALEAAKDESLQTLLRIGALCNDSHLASKDGAWKIKGDTTEGALVVVAAKGGLNHEQLDMAFPRVGEIPFSSERKQMTTVHQGATGRVAYTKGAPEMILNACNRIYLGGEHKPLTDSDKEKALAAAQQMAADALRVLGIAYKPLSDGDAVCEETERNMVFVGFVGMIDPPRPEAKEAIRLCQRAGIKSVMITGDHKLTAMAVAKELGLLKGGQALTGAELDKLSDQELENVVEQVEVYARVSPAHKMRIIDAFRKHGEVVAMTGDGVNDAPALKKADIGIAMGITGTDVSKEAAAMVLTDDNFASIVGAVEEGRGIFGNIKKYLIYLMSCNLGEILLMVVAILAGLPLPLVAIQILWVNLATDGLPALALAVDPADPDIMDRPPRSPKEGVFTASVLRYLVFIGIWTGVVTLAAFLWALHRGESMEEAQTLTFVTLVLTEFFNAFNCRSERYSIFKIGPFKNRWLLLAIAWEAALLMLIVYLPCLHGPFNTYPLTLQDWGVAIAMSASILVVVEAGKFIGALRARKRAASSPAS